MIMHDVSRLLVIYTMYCCLQLGLHLKRGPRKKMHSVVRNRELGLAGHPSMCIRRISGTEYTCCIKYLGSLFPACPSHFAVLVCMS